MVPVSADVLDPLLGSARLRRLPSLSRSLPDSGPAEAFSGLAPRRFA
jgi:hypothetical protein